MTGLIRLPATEVECVVDTVWNLAHWGVPLWWQHGAPSAGKPSAADRTAGRQAAAAAGAGRDTASPAAPAAAAAPTVHKGDSGRLSVIARRLIQQLQHQQLAPDIAAKVSGKQVMWGEELARWKVV
jgi:hypothetical protein